MSRMRPRRSTTKRRERSPALCKSVGCSREPATSWAVSDGLPGTGADEHEGVAGGVLTAEGAAGVCPPARGRGHGNRHHEGEDASPGRGLDHSSRSQAHRLQWLHPAGPIVVIHAERTATGSTQVARVPSSPPEPLTLARESPYRARTTQRNLQVFAVAPERRTRAPWRRSSALPPGARRAPRGGR